jgi:hypothetical protein
VIVVTKTVYLRGQSNIKLRDRKLGRFYCRRADWATQSQIETSSYSTRTLNVSRQQSKTLL